MLPAVAETVADLRAARAALPGPVVLVPTMGALHEGHRTLVRAARAWGGSVVVSVFVNPTQFGPGEDFDRYPRTWDADLAALAEEGADLVFHPGVADVYPAGALGVGVDPGPLGSVLEGAVRPGHFAGVLTVVAKLFGLVRPDVAVFGEKDYQQLTLIRAMARELALGVEVVGVPTVREPDGMALSSRNRYLSGDQRRAAAVVSAALRAGAAAGPAGPAAVLAAAHAVLAAEPGLVPDYLELTDPDLAPAPARGPARLLVAVRAGSTRLLDNAPIDLGDPR
ncbi:pantoate--beta-alanine ligase [Goekera deserti]|uniref:pantoate--beta-alanine ligase n=1 Tax=Goekera deserti TaxID=2497753 RepID=UPI001F27F46F|nr:pantoate--beta-alanine ligase [Goekera deserti]